jgi:hypothetical protein
MRLDVALTPSSAELFQRGFVTGFPAGFTGDLPLDSLGGENENANPAGSGELVKHMRIVVLCWLHIMRMAYSRGRR